MKKISKRYKEILEAYQDRLDAIRKATTVDRSETLAQKNARKATLLEDYGAFCQHYFPHLCKGPSASFHINLAQELSERNNCFLVKQWARSLAKSTNAGVLAPLWLMLRGELSFMVYVSKSEDNAIGLLSNVQAELESNDRLIYDYSHFVRHGKWELGNFQTRQGCIFKAIGRGQSPRGLNVNGRRPDLVLVDDIDDNELSRNPKRVRLAASWVLGALRGTFNITGRKRFVVVGNLINKCSILATVSENPLAEVERINLLDEQGNPSWDYHSKEDCDYMIKSMGNDALPEYFNTPITAGTVYKKSYFTYAPTLPLEEYDAIVVYTDPSFKAKSDNDYKATVCLAKIGPRYHLLKARVERTTVSAMIDWHYEIDAWIAGRAAVFWYIEANFTQDIFLKDFQTAANKRGKLLPVVGDKRKKPNKEARIEAMSPIFQNGFFTIAVEEQDCEHVAELINQFILFEKGSKAPDDAPDATEGAIFLLDYRTSGQQQTTWVESPKQPSKYRY